ncbi:MAG: tRNA uridine-5-carboxymethylaminomethyl(34) synthesis GTPase MnmE [Marinilabiliales bacterium]|nr:MAG: tRNA uridine-5-carboxymethylaminomethyl(34) synthesis GTPase MnmE [Marinilabiliales bacterium]
MNYESNHNDTICALATAGTGGAISVIRISGNKAIETGNKLMKLKSGTLSELPGGSFHFARIIDNEELVDEVIVNIFRSPHSYTGEDTLEISCHASIYIQQKILTMLNNHGIRIAQPGEFTQRAFLNGKMDLSQAEAVADIIAAQSKNAHKIAFDQMRGGYSSEIKSLRDRLVKLTALMELELDFSEEDVEFADRDELFSLVNEIKNKIKSLTRSFSFGNAIKNGIPVTIAGEPNVGKSTLLNLLLNEDKAIVSNIPGTTRDTIEDIFNIEGTDYRFIDTAGIRNTDNDIENQGISRTFKKIRQSKIVLYLTDNNTNYTSLDKLLNEINTIKAENTELKLILVVNKTDLFNPEENIFKELLSHKAIDDYVMISSLKNDNLHVLHESIHAASEIDRIEGNEIIVSNIRHFEALKKANTAIEQSIEGFDNKIPTDLIAIDVRQAISHLSSITDMIHHNEVLGYIFENFCIGK